VNSYIGENRIKGNFMMPLILFYCITCEELSIDSRTTVTLDVDCLNINYEI
jgi:hypothetical protein